MVCGQPCVHVPKAPRHHPLPSDSLLLSAQGTHLNVSSLRLTIKKCQELRLREEGCSHVCERDGDFPLGLKDRGSCYHLLDSFQTKRTLLKELRETLIFLGKLHFYARVSGSGFQSELVPISESQCPQSDLMFQLIGC